VDQIDEITFETGLRETARSVKIDRAPLVEKHVPRRPCRGIIVSFPPGKNNSKAQHVLEHMGAHLLFDTSLDRSLELCGLCLRPAPICLIFLKKGRGVAAGYSIDYSRSTCINMVRFKYATASRSSETSPCSNVPRICPLCPANNPAVWTYNFDIHFGRRHKITSPVNFPMQVQLSESEKDGLRRKWETRFKLRNSRNLKKSKKNPLVCSAAHSTRLALR
jgi:hypothetical protein